MRKLRWKEEEGRSGGGRREEGGEEREMGVGEVERGKREEKEGGEEEGEKEVEKGGWVEIARFQKQELPKPKRGGHACTTFYSTICSRTQSRGAL